MQRTSANHGQLDSFAREHPLTLVSCVHRRHAALRARSAPPRSASPIICLIFSSVIPFPSTPTHHHEPFVLAPSLGRHDLAFDVTGSRTTPSLCFVPHLLTLCPPRAPFSFRLLLSLFSPFIHRHVFVRLICSYVYILFRYYRISLFIIYRCLACIYNLI